MSVRRILTPLACAALLVLAGCAGDTSPASNIRATQAQLNAHGHTNNGPARWWWEYGIGRASVANGGGTKTPIRGPASSASDVNLNEVVKNLGADQSYFFRACGQDTKAGSTPTCGRVREFFTAPADSPVQLNTTDHFVRFDAAPGTQHKVTVIDDGTSGELNVKDPVPDPQTDPPTGSALTPGPPCINLGDHVFLDVAACSGGGPITRFLGFLGPLDDSITLATLTGTAGELHGGGGNDSLTGSGFSDQLFGDAGNDVLDGGAGADAMTGGPGFDTYVCTSGDIAFTDSTAEANQAQAAGCN